MRSNSNSPQSQSPKPRRNSNIHPVDLGEALGNLSLGIGAAAKMCGVSIRQLSYWSDKGIFSTDSDSKIAKATRKSSKQTNRSRTFDYPAIEKACLIKQALDLGYSLEAAVSEAETFLQKQLKSEKQLEKLSERALAEAIGEQAQSLSGLAERIRRGLRTYRVSGDLGRMAASSRGLEKLISFFEANPYTVNTSRQIALRLGRAVEEVTKELEILEGQNFIQKISYPGNDIYRYLPRRR